MSFLISVLTGFRFLDRRTDDDFVDRLHYSLSTNILIGLSVLVSWKQFGGKPLECMPPDIYPPSWEQFVENFCWAQDTYHVPRDQELDLDHDSYKKLGKVSYYKWVPLCLLFSAMSFQLPYYMWKILSHRSGVMLLHIIHQASDPKNVMPDVRPTTIKLISIYIENAMRFHKRVTNLHSKNSGLPITSHFYVTFIYLLVKFSYLLNVLLNFFMMNYLLNVSGSHARAGQRIRNSNFGFLDQDDQDSKFTQITQQNESLIDQTYRLYGWHILKLILNGNDTELCGFFPRVTVCDFQARVLGHIQQHSIQCVLVINIFNEKIFVFLWFWYHFLTLVSVLGLLYWTFVSLTPFCRRWFIIQHLDLADMPFDYQEEKGKVEHFVFRYLKIDGVFILRMINNHTGAIFTSDLVASLWRTCLRYEQKVDQMTNPALSRTRWPSIEKKGGLGASGARDDTEIVYRTVPARRAGDRSPNSLAMSLLRKKQSAGQKSGEDLEAMLENREENKKSS